MYINLYLSKYKFYVNSTCSYIIYLPVHRYNISWYQAPLQIQKLILFLLQRDNKAFTWNIGGLFIIFFECFASVMLYYICKQYCILCPNNIIKTYLFAVGQCISILLYCHVIFSVIKSRMHVTHLIILKQTGCKIFPFLLSSNYMQKLQNYYKYF